MKKTHTHAKSQTQFTLQVHALKCPLPLYSQSTPDEIFDVRCEYEVPRYLDLNELERIDEEEK